MNVVDTNLVRRGNSANDDTIGHYVQWGQPSGGAKVILNQGDKPKTLDNNYFIGYNIPEFHKRLSKGELLPFTPWKKFSCVGETSGTYDIFTTGNYHSWYEPDPGYNVGDGWLITEEDFNDHIPLHIDVYVTNAAAKIYSSGFDALTFLAELKDVRHMFENITNGLKHLQIPKGWRKMHSVWLESRYGWRPLISDIKTLNKIIQALNDKRSRYSERAGHSYKTTHTQATETEWSAFSVSQIVIDKVTVGVRGSVVADIEVPQFQFNPLVTGWEVIPFSFVADWFINVGQTLSSLAFSAREKAYSASQGYQIKIERSFSRRMVKPKSNFISGTFRQDGTCVAELEVRIPCVVPQTFPQACLRLDGFKIFDLLAIARQRFA